MNIDESLTEFIDATTLSDIPDETVDHAKKLALKTAAGMITGSVQPTGRRMTDYITGRPTAPEETGVIGAGIETNRLDAVAANGMYAHVSELEDDKMVPGEDTSWDITTFPVTMPLAGTYRRSGDEFLLASILSLEIQTRLSAVVRRTGATRSIVRAGSLAAAVGAAACMDLDADQVNDTLGIAIGGGSVFTPNTGFDAHYLDSVFQCLRGVRAADLARAGFTGNPDFEALFESYGDEAGDPSSALEGLGETWLFHGIGIKKYPCCFHTHRHIDALKELVEERQLEVSDVDEIIIETGTVEANMCNRPNPQTREDAKFSFQHILGSTLVDGDVNYDHLAEDILDDPRYKDARKKVKVTVRPDWTKAREGPAIVRVTQRSGATIETAREHMIGSRFEPLSLEECRGLYEKFSRGILPDDAIEYTADAILNIEDVADMKEVMDVLTYGDG